MRRPLISRREEDGDEDLPSLNSSIQQEIQHQDEDENNEIIQDENEVIGQCDFECIELIIRRGESTVTCREQYQIPSDTRPHTFHKECVGSFKEKGGDYNLMQSCIITGCHNSLPICRGCGNQINSGFPITRCPYHLCNALYHPGCTLRSCDACKTTMRRENAGRSQLSYLNEDEENQEYDKEDREDGSEGDDKL
jgi:hypothetical protein